MSRKPWEIPVQYNDPRWQESAKPAPTGLPNATEACRTCAKPPSVSTF